jgi:KAP family P-loop domain
VDNEKKDVVEPGVTNIKRISGLQEPTEDCLNREDFANVFTNYITNIDSAVLALNSPWGEGKTFFIEKVLFEKLDEKKKPYFYLNAFACDYYDDPFSAIIDTLITEFHEHEKELKIKTWKLKKLWGKAKKAKQVFGSKFRAGIPDMAADIGNMVGLGNTTKIFTASAIAGEKELYKNNTPVSSLEDWIKDKNEEKNALESIRSALEDIVKELNGESLVFFIDELDRCRPDFAVELLEKIKHIFSVKGIIFVLAVNPDQIHESIQHIYGQGINAPEYLHKFFDLQFTLPHSTAQKGYVLIDYIKHYLEQVYPDENSGFYNKVADEANVSLRDIQKIFQLLYVVKANHSYLTEFNLLFLLATAKIKKIETSKDSRGIIENVFDLCLSERYNSQLTHSFLFQIKKVSYYFKNYENTKGDIQHEINQITSRSSYRQEQLYHLNESLDFLKSLNLPADIKVKGGIQRYAQAIEHVFNYISPEDKKDTDVKG